MDVWLDGKKVQVQVSINNEYFSELLDYLMCISVVALFLNYLEMCGTDRFALSKEEST